MNKSYFEAFKGKYAEIKLDIARLTSLPKLAADELENGMFPRFLESHLKMAEARELAAILAAAFPENTDYKSDFDELNEQLNTMRQYLLLMLED